MHDQPAVLLNPIADACRRLGIKRTKLYQLIADRKIKPIKIGQRTLIPEAELTRYVDELVIEQSAP